MIDLAGQVALIPGASGGIGREVARLFAECGADVALAYRSREAEATAVLDHAHRLGRRARLDCVDSSDYGVAKAWVEDVLREYGRVDILASCIGGNLPGGFSPFIQQDPASWRQIVDAQLSFFYLCRPVVEHMIERKTGRIIALGSDGGKVGESGVAVASARNAGLMGFAKSLAREVGRFGITVNVVCPGPTEGPTLDRHRSQGNAGSKIIEEMIRRVPMKRLGTAREIAATMVFLASADAGYITGQAISVSGGLTMS